MEGPSQAVIDCHDNEDGSVLVTYLPTLPGQYAVHVLCNDEDITNSPFIVNVQPPPTTHFDPSKVDHLRVIHCSLSVCLSMCKQLSC